MSDVQKSEREILSDIYKDLHEVNNDQKHIGKFIGESIHSIRKWIIFFGILLIINILLQIFF